MGVRNLIKFHRFRLWRTRWPHTVPGMSSLQVIDGPNLTEQVAAEVRAYMARRRMTQARLAEVLGLSQSGVSARLAGKVPFRLDELEKVADALGVHPVRLLGGTPDGDGPSPWRGHTQPYLQVVPTLRDEMPAQRVISTQQSVAA